MASRTETRAHSLPDEEELFGSALEEFTAAADSLFEAHQLVNKNPGDRVAQAKLKRAEKRVELLRSERDNAGAFKIKQFDRELQGMFVGSPPKIEQTQSGFFALAESEKNRRLMFVDMLELDRFNKEGGGHDAGDKALAKTVEAIKAAIESKLGGREGRQAAFKVLRTGGNQYMVSFENLDAATFEEIQETVRASKPTIREGIEPAPLVVTGIDFREVVEDLNVVQSELPKGARIDSGAPAAKEMMQLLLRNADWGAEVRKFTKRTDRVKEKLEAGDPGVEDFFKNYAAKGFQGTEFATLESFRAMIADGSFAEKVRESATASAHKRFEIDRQATDAETSAADVRARDEMLKQRVEAHTRREAPERTTGRGGPYAEIPPRTDGEKVLERKQAAVTNAKSELAKLRARPGVTEEDLEVQEIMVETAELEYQVEDARRNIGTGLLERGVYYEDLENDLREGKEVSSVFIDMGFLKYFDQKGGVDVGNNALRLAASLIEKAIDKAGVEGKAYRYGGDEFTVLVRGGKAEAAKVMKALAELNAEAGKVASGPKSKPEYVPTELQFNYGYADTEALEQLLEASGRKETSTNKKAELMTKAADVGVEYLKAVSRFEYLISQMRDPRYVEKKPGLAVSDESTESLEEILRMSETETQRTLSEVFGIQPKRTGASGEDFTRQVESKIGYSNKALFAEAGGETVLRVFADELRHLRNLPPEEAEGLEEEIYDQIRTFVYDRVQAAHAAEAGRRDVMDELLEARTAAQFLGEEVVRLESVGGEQKRQIAALKLERDRAVRNFEQLAAAKGALRGGPENGASAAA